MSLQIRLWKLKLIWFLFHFDLQNNSKKYRGGGKLFCPQPAGGRVGGRSDQGTSERTNGQKNERTNKRKNTDPLASDHLLQILCKKSCLWQTYTKTARDIVQHFCRWSQPLHLTRLHIFCRRPNVKILIANGHGNSDQSFTLPPHVLSQSIRNRASPPAKKSLV